MTETKLAITPDCRLVMTTYAAGNRELELEYIEHSSDHWHSDTDILVTISESKALEMIAFLKNYLACPVK